jgi:hypothetical protein
MPPTNVVVDGSNIATEGRSTPSLEQLDQAVRQYLDENPGSRVTVVVDASFGHRIDPSERPAFEEAVAHGEIVSPPAGAIGRGDAFLLRIAERIGARVLSNDSFREFHTDHPWLFDEDRLVGGTPVPGVGWIFSPRRPVRGPVTPSDGATKGRGGRGRKADSAEKKAREQGSEVRAAIAQATEEALGPKKQKKQASGSRKRKEPTAPEAVNDPLPFITFASEHPVGSELQGTVVSFTSHGAMAQVGDMLCYVPLAGLADPPPRRARDVLKLGEVLTFQLVALDPARRGAQLALPEVVVTQAQIAEGAEEAASAVRRKRKKEQPTTAVKATKATKAAGATKAAKASKAVQASNPAKSVKPVKATRASKATKATKATKVAKVTKVAKASKAAKAAKTTKAAKAKDGVAKKSSSAKKAAPASGASTTRKVVKSR